MLHNTESAVIFQQEDKTILLAVSQGHFTAGIFSLYLANKIILERMGRSCNSAHNEMRIVLSLSTLLFAIFFQPDDDTLLL